MKNNFNEEKFDSFLNKTIIYSSKAYYKEQKTISNNEKMIIDDCKNNKFLQNFADVTMSNLSIDNIDLKLELKEALSCLSNMEQAVIFLLFEEDLKQSVASEILQVYSKSISKIKKRALNKLRKQLKGDFDYE